MKNKVAIICNHSLEFSPYVDFYCEICKHNNIDYIIISKEQKYEKKENHIAFIQDEAVLKMNAIKRTFKWYAFLCKHLIRHKCNKIIALPTRTAILHFPLLLWYTNRYIIDIRDYTNEHNYTYKKIEDHLIKKSYMTVISSNGFRQWLTQSDKICNIHNMAFCNKKTMEAKDVMDRTITIGYIGFVNYPKQNKKLLTSLKNNEKYHIKFSGEISTNCDIVEFCEKNNIKNVNFTGKFNNKDKAILYADVDMINAIYGNESLVVTTALPNKLYDAIIYKKPIIASKGTYLSEIIEKYKVGMSVDIEKDNICELLDEYWRNYDAEEFSTNCDRMMKDVELEQQDTINKIVEFLMS